MPRQALVCSFVILLILLPSLTGCGGGGSTTGGGGGGGGGTADFALTVQPSILALTPGSSGNITVGVTGSAGSVNISITGMPAGVTASPTQFSVASGAQQAVTFTASATAATASVSLTVSGSSGSVSHSAKAALLVNLAQKSAHSSSRTSYVRTGVQWDVSFLNFAPQRLILYHAPTRRFFSSNTFLNRVDVIDANTEQLVSEIPVPGAFAGDVTPDQTAIYLGTQVGDVYKIDPVSMTVLQRFPAIQIGPFGFPTFEVRALADGRLALLGTQGGIPAVDGFNALAIWNPVDNSFFVAPRSTPGQSFGHVSEFTLTADRTKVLLGFGESGGTVASYDPVTDAVAAAVTNPLGIGVEAILTPTDGKEIIVPSGAEVQIFDANTFFLTDSFVVGNGTDFFFYQLSQDGNTLYAFPRNSGGDILAFDWRTHQLKGWLPSMDFLDLGVGIDPNAIDETGLMAAQTAHGVGFVDAGALHPGSPTSVVTNSFVAPSFGPVGGGSSTQITYIANPPSAKNVFFGNQLGANVSLLGEGASAISPAGTPGPVDVTVELADGNLVFAPESFSYGPSIVEVVTDSTTAEGGSTGTVFGYGFGDAFFGGKPATGLQLQVNGTVVSNLTYSPAPFGSNYFLPIESLTFTLPPGKQGNAADLTVSNSAGSVTVTQAVHYLPAVKQFPLPGSALVQGIYDPKRDVYYFSDATKIQVFSETQGVWLAPISMPAGATRLWGLSLSPDGSKLAVSDAGAQEIFVVNPDTPTTVSSFSALAPDDTTPGGEPAGVAITDSGIVYYMVFYTQFTGPSGLHKLDTATGTVKGFQSVPAVDLGEDALTRVLLSNDNARLYMNVAGFLLNLDTATDTLFTNPAIPTSDPELTLSSNQTWMSASGWSMDTNLNPESFLTFSDPQGSTAQEVFGAKLSPDGSLLFQPLVDGIDVFDGKQGTLRTRIALPFQLSENYDALVADGKDNVLVGILGASGDGGVAVIDLTTLPLPEPQPFELMPGLLPPNRQRLAAGASIMRSAALKATAAATSAKSHRTKKHVISGWAGTMPQKSSIKPTRP